MGEFIRREAAKEFLCDFCIANELCTRNGNCFVMTKFEAIPAADVVERKSANWKGAGLGDYYCSICNETYSIGAERVNDWHFCPNCGADMRPNPPKEKA